MVIFSKRALRRFNMPRLLDERLEGLENNGPRADLSTTILDFDDAEK